MAIIETARMYVAAQQYPWWQITRRSGMDWEAALPQVFTQVSQAGIQGWEPSLQSAAEVQPLAALLEQHQLLMRSCYAGGEFHTERAAETIERIAGIAQAAKPHGVEVVVVNPDPISWGGPENKTDEQLRTQTDALATLGHRLHELGMVLGYHTHDAEMRAAAREFHHMMLATDPAHVGLCLDAHWMYRGAENSVVALLDVVRLYGNRVKLVHLRQSHNGIWSETCEAGDIDYATIALQLARHEIHPLLVLEQAIEQGTPQTMTPVEAHRRGRAYVEHVFRR